MRVPLASVMGQEGKRGFGELGVGSEGVVMGRGPPDDGMGDDLPWMGEDDSGNVEVKPGEGNGWVEEAEGQPWAIDVMNFVDSVGCQ